MTTQPPLVVIVGGGLGGLAAAKEMNCSCVNVLLFDRSNHHVFQPLLYQVATSVLAPGQIASPIRNLLANQANTSMMLGNVTGVDAISTHVIVDANDKVGLKLATTIRRVFAGELDSESVGRQAEDFVLAPRLQGTKTSQQSELSDTGRV
jgi:NADH dehydrogenase FAD-containing subunit